MAFIAPEQPKAPKKLMKPGNYVARCYQLIEIGTVENTYKNDGSTQHKIRIGWEFPTQKEVFSENKGAEPFTMGRDYNWSMNEKANLRIDLESWAGQSFTDVQAAKFDIERLLGKACLINVVTKINKKNVEVNEIKTIAPLPDGVVCPAQINQTQKLSFSEWDQSMFDSLPKWIRESIQASREYKAMSQPAEPAMQKAYSIGGDANQEGSDDLPF